MDDLQQQEALVESQIETYQSQLKLVDEQLDSAGDGDVSDLQQLKSDLTELIALTKESLLEIKKQRLLLMLQGPGTAPNPHEPEKPSESEGGGGGVEQLTDGGQLPEEEEEEEEEDLEGLYCQAPLKEAWDAVNYHNAVIIGRERGGTEMEEGGEEKVRVLFTHPTYNAMKPCPYFLNGNCRFTDDTCKFSHGHSVPLSDLRPFQEPDFSLVHIGGKCLARHSDDLWHQALISSLGDTFTVHFTTLNATVQLEPDSILPLESSDESSSSSSDDEEEGQEGEEEVVGVIEWRPTGPDYALGDWEKHTTGIGSKLLAKMGYVVGKGLGKSEQGRVEPVEIVVLPAGKSLDMCAELREAKKLRKPVGQGSGSQRRKRRRKGKGADSVEHVHQQQGEERDIFDFLNKKLLRKDSRFAEPSTCGGEDSAGLRKTGGARHGNSAGKESLNVKLFKVQEEMKALKKRRHSLKQTLLRHKGKNNSMEAHTQEKLAAADRELAQLQRHEQSIQKSITSKTEQRKLTVF